MTLPEILAQAEALAKKATALPWHIHQPKIDFLGPQILEQNGGILVEMTSYGKNRADAAYLCFAANNLMTLIQAVKDQQVEKVLMEGEMKGWKVLYDVRTEELKALRAELENYRGRYRGVTE